MRKCGGSRSLPVASSTKSGRSSAMWKRLFELLQQALFLQRDVKQNKEDTTKLRADLQEAQKAVRALANEVQRLSEREQNEREKFILKVENVLLRFERRLSPAKKGKKRK